MEDRLVNYVKQDNTRTKTTNPVVKMTVVLDPTLLQIKVIALFAIQVNTKTKMVNQVVSL